jgi:hypothetical protein
MRFLASYFLIGTSQVGFPGSSSEEEVRGQMLIRGALGVDTYKRQGRKQEQAKGRVRLQCKNQ